MKWVYNNRVYRKCVIREANIGFSKPSGFKATNIVKDIHYSNRRHKQTINPDLEKVLILQKPVPILKKKFRILILDKF